MHYSRLAGMIYHVRQESCESEHLLWGETTWTQPSLCLLCVWLWANNLLMPLTSLLNGVNTVPTSLDLCEDPIADIFKALEQQTWQALIKCELLWCPAVCSLKPWRTLECFFWMQLPRVSSLCHAWGKSAKCILAFQDEMLAWHRSSCTGFHY